MLLLRRLMSAVDDAAIVSSQSTLTLGKYNAVQPDLMLLRPRSDYYRRSNPTPADLLLAVEISESTWRYDREVKAPLYAQHGVRELWIVGLRMAELHCLRAPRDGIYAEADTIANPRMMRVPGLGAIEVDLCGLFD